MCDPRQEHQRLHGWVAGTLRRLERGKPPPLRHFTLTRRGAELRIGCWCGTARVLETTYPTQFARQLDGFLWEHENCQRKEGA